MKKLAIAISLLSVSACTTPGDINNNKVFFAFDSAEITDEAAKSLKEQSYYLKKNPNVNVVLGGHCDERGSVDYNLALGALRAGNASQVLLKEGIKSDRIKTISYGKENPQYIGTGEKIWAKNRNVTTVVKENTDNK